MVQIDIIDIRHFFPGNHVCLSRITVKIISGSITYSLYIMFKPQTGWTIRRASAQLQFVQHTFFLFLYLTQKRGVTFLKCVQNIVYTRTLYGAVGAHGTPPDPTTLKVANLQMVRHLYILILHLIHLRIYYICTFCCCCCFTVYLVWCSFPGDQTLENVLCIFLNILIFLNLFSSLYVPSRYSKKSSGDRQV